MEPGRITTARGRLFETARLTEPSFLIVMAALIGVLGGFGALLFRYLIQFVQQLLYGSSGHFQEVFASVPWYLRIAGPMIGGLVVGPLVYRLAREARGHGVPEVMEAVTLRGGVIRPRVAFVKTIASAITIGTGGAVGREGPIVQIGSAVGSLVGQITKAPTDRVRTYVGCGAAAGIAATFNAPIAGALFSIEIILGDIGFQAFSPIVISSVVATVISRHFLGDAPAFIVPQYSLISAWELLLYGALGVIISFLAVIFTKTVYWSEDLFQSLSIPDSLKASLSGLIFGAAFFALPQVYGVGYDIIENTIAGNGAWAFLLLLAFLKIVSTSLTLGGGGSGGIFAPSLFIGAVFGAAFGQLAHALFPSITATAGAYALVGMGAMVAGATHAPLTAIVILFELTSDYKIILPLMISCIIATVISSSLSRDSIYTLKLTRRGVNLSGGREHSIMRGLSVRDVMHPDIETVPEGMSLRQLLSRVATSATSYFPVVNSDGEMTGILSLKDLRPAIQEEGLADLVVARDIATQTVITVTPDDDLTVAMDKFGRKGIPFLPVVANAGSNQLVGRLHRRDVIEAYNRAVLMRPVERSEVSQGSDAEWGDSADSGTV